MSKQQKNTERFLAKKQMLLNRKDECARNVRDLGVLPEEAFVKYTGEKLDRVCRLVLWPSNKDLKRLRAAGQEATCRQ